MDDYDAAGYLTPQGCRRVLARGGVIYLASGRVINTLAELEQLGHTEQHMEHETETVQLPPAQAQGLARIVADEWAQDELAAEQFQRYLAAKAEGIIGKLVDCTIQHGTPEGGRLRWLVVRDGITLEAYYSPDTSGLEVKRNGEAVLDDGAEVLLFDPGAHGRWIQTLLLEHERLQRQAQQKVMLAQRAKEVDALARSKRDI